MFVKLLKYFGYVPIKELTKEIDIRVRDLKNQAPMGGITVKEFDNLSDKDRAFWYSQRYEWDAQAHALLLFKHYIEFL